MTRVVGLLVVLAAGCGPKACEKGSFQCDGNVLQECGADGWTDSMDCTDMGAMCHAEMGHCMAEDSGE
jgi:hypothetical protein